MTIHKEGRPFLLVLILFLVVINIPIFLYHASDALKGIVTGGSVLLFLFVLQFFRNPRIIVTQGEKYILAPADGKVVVIEKTLEKEYLQEERIQISIFMSPVNVHINRNPVSGVIRYFKYHPGKYLVAWHPKSSTDNERTTLVYEMANGLLLPVRQIAGAMARRIKYYLKEGEDVIQGEEFGFIKFGSRVDVFVPLGASLKVEIGQSTRAGVTVLAELPK